MDKRFLEDIINKASQDIMAVMNRNVVLLTVADADVDDAMEFMTALTGMLAVATLGAVDARHPTWTKELRRRFVSGAVDSWLEKTQRFQPEREVKRG